MSPYRDNTRAWGDAPAAIRVRNVRRSAWHHADAFYLEQAIV